MPIQSPIKIVLARNRSNFTMSCTKCKQNIPISPIERDSRFHHFTILFFECTSLVSKSHLRFFFSKIQMAFGVDTNLSNIGCYVNYQMTDPAGDYTLLNQKPSDSSDVGHGMQVFHCHYHTFYYRLESAIHYAASTSSVFADYANIAPLLAAFSLKHLINNNIEIHATAQMQIANFFHHPQASLIDVNYVVAFGHIKWYKTVGRMFIVFFSIVRRFITVITTGNL